MEAKDLKQIYLDTVEGTEPKDLRKIYLDTVQVTEPDVKKFAELFRQIIGDQTLREYGSKLEMSASTLSRMLNGKINKPLPSETLLKIVETSNVPKKDYLDLYKELARANGMMLKAEEHYIRQFINAFTQRNDMHKSVKELMSTIILARLAERGVAIKGTENVDIFASSGCLKNVTELDIRYDFNLDVATKQQQFTWVFWTFPQTKEDFVKESFEPRNIANKLIKELSPVFLADAWNPKLYSETKISFCFVDGALFDNFCSLLTGAKLNNRFSAVLIDEDNCSIKNEYIFASADHINEKSLFDLPPVTSFTPSKSEGDKEIVDEFVTFSEEGDQEEQK